MSTEPAATGGTAAGPAAVDPRRALSLSDATIRLGGRTVWEGVSIDVAPGEYVAVLGPNGAGKSTLFRAILGLLPLSRGSVSVLGRPAGRGNPGVGYLPQRRSFDPDLRVRGLDLVRLGLDGARWGVPLPLAGPLPGAARRRERDRRVAQAVELVGAAAYASRPIGELSGGEQQRLLIAQALVSRPRLLLLDEPLESLDLSNQQQISALTRRICREQGVTVLLVAHDVNAILPHLDRVIYIAGGRSLIGAPREVITSEKLSALYGTPVEVVPCLDGRLVVVGQPEAASYHPHG